jgi:hypothetical protein
MTPAIHSQAGDPVAIALGVAIRAPSPHNTQPWRFEIAADRIDVLLDCDRVLAVVDRDAREARLSCGAAIVNMQPALRAASFLFQPVEIPATRAALSRLLGGQVHPQTVLRFGYGFAAPATRRRRPEEVARHRNQTEEVSS